MFSYSNLDEEQLIRLVQSGEQDAFAPLVSKYKNLVFSLMLKSVADFHLAEELSQDVFINAFKGLKFFRFEARFSTWLTKIALNTAVNYKTSKLAAQRRVTVSEESGLLSIQNSAEEKLQTKQKISAFQKCYEKLSERLKKAMLLVALQNYSYEECSEILAIPVGTVRSRLNQARLLVIECMSKTYGGDIA